MIVGVILAAGASSRMGSPKALLALGSDTFASRICRSYASAGVDDIVVVAGPEMPAVDAALQAAGIRARIVENTRREEGQLSSLQVGLALADRPGVEAVLVSLVDVPLVAPGTIRAIADAFLRTHAPVIRPVGPIGRHGHPVLFSRALFDELRHADPAVGARSVIRAHAAEAIEVPVDDEGAYADIDTPEDYDRLVQRFKAGSSGG